MRCFRKSIFVALILTVAMLPILAGCSKDDQPEGLIGHLPKPHADFDIIDGTPDKLIASIPDTSLPQFEAYRQACIDMGYTGNVEDLPISYRAANKDGYLLEIAISKSILYVTLTAPAK